VDRRQNQQYSAIALQSPLGTCLRAVKGRIRLEPYTVPAHSTKRKKRKNCGHRLDAKIVVLRQYKPTGLVSIATVLS